MIELMVDTPAEGKRRYYELLRQAGIEGRARAFVSNCRRMRAFAEAGIRQAYPDISAHEMRVRLTVRLYGREVAARLFGQVPDDAR